MPAPSPVVHHAGTRPSPMRSTALGIVALSLGAVALLVSWVPWVNLLGLVLALGGLVTGGIVAVMGRSLARGLGIAGASLAVVALVITAVLLGASAVDEVRERVAASEPEPPTSPGSEAEPTPAEPPGDPAPVETSPGEGSVVDVGEEMALDGATGVVDQLSVNASWAPGAAADSGAAPESASIIYRLILTDGSGSASFDASYSVETSVVDAEGTVLTAGTCIEPGGGSQFTEPAPSGSYSIERCVDLPIDYDGSITLTIETPSVADSPVYVITGTVAVDDLSSPQP